MNDKKLKVWSIVGVVIIFLLASLWHFMYDWMPSGVSATIFPVNESPWEHVKLFFFPAIIFYVIQYYIVGKNYKNFIFSHGLMLLLMPALTLGLFYFYRLALNIPESLLIDIIITFICIALGSWAAYKLTLSDLKLQIWKYVALVIVLVLFTVNTIFTFYTPHKPIFYDKNIEAYGLDEGTGDDDHGH